MKETFSNHLKEFVQAEAQGVFAFGVALGLATSDPEWLSDIFSDFGSQFRARAKQKGFIWEPMELKVLLYSVAWKHLKPLLSGQTFERFSLLGRDTRLVQKTETDLFQVSQSDFQQEFVPRLGHLDLEQRVLIVLRDVLQFSDEEAMRVTDLRWGIYRHRLHRGRLELEAL